MADIALRSPENARGKYYVDSSCIDCMLCKDLAPNNFELDPNKEVFYISKQPENNEELDQVMDAVDSCPSQCIGEDGDAAG